MLDKLLGGGQSQLPSVIKDPFLKDNVTQINIWWFRSSHPQGWSARVKFQNGLTEGSQDTGNCSDFDTVLQRLKQILDEVQRKK